MTDTETEETSVTSFEKIVAVPEKALKLLRGNYCLLKTLNVVVLFVQHTKKANACAMPRTVVQYMTRPEVCLCIKQSVIVKKIKALTA